jgi:membrane-bound lytic murein transglycosylase B
MRYTFTFALPLIFGLLASSVQAATLPGIPEFIDEMVLKHQFNHDDLVELFQRAQHRPVVIEAISRPSTIKPWLEYRAAFVNQKRVQLGLAFWDQYPQTLRRAEKQFGVPQEIIVAIIGVETIYGRNAGNFRVIDALTTLAFDYPRRAEFFRGELEQYLLLAREQDFDLLAIRSSYAGALGVPQFMPSSYRKYAIDFNGNHKIDLLREDRDAIGSVANYMQGYGWKGGEPVAVRVHSTMESCLGETKSPRSLSDWATVGMTPEETLPGDMPARLLDFTVAEGKEFWLGLNNFEVITRYNNSDFYAMSVFQLAEALKKARQLNAVK